MEHALLGKTGRKVTRIGFGGAPAGLKDYLESYDPDDRNDREKSIAAIRRAVELGITYYDTAPGYGNGRSEDIFGEALDGVDEDAIFLATKIAPNDPDATRQSIEQSLRRLRRSRIDLFQIHGTAYTPAHEEGFFRKGGMIDQIERAREEGLTRFIGFTVEAINETTLRLIKCGRFDTVQLAYNIMYQHPCDPYWKYGTMYDAEEMKMGIVVMRTLTSGLFQRWIKTVSPEDTFDYSEALLQFVLSNPLVDVALLGMRTVENVEKNVRACENLAGRIDMDEFHRKYPVTGPPKG